MSAGGGSLVLVSTPIGNLSDLSQRAIETLGSADLVACEDTRHSGRLLAHAGIRARKLLSLHEHNEAARALEIIVLIEQGATVALISDAGTPLVSDPGSRLVAAVAAAGLCVSVVPGPSAVLAALVVSGFDTARFVFEGFLPRKGAERRARIAEIASAVLPSVCYESPKRLATTLVDLAEACGGDRRVVVARELTKLHEEIWRGDLAGAAERAGASEARGEHVVVLDSSRPPEAKPLHEVDELAGRLRMSGLSARDVAAAVEVVLGVSHKVAYEAALRSMNSAETRP